MKKCPLEGRILNLMDSHLRHTLLCSKCELEVSHWLESWGWTIYLRKVVVEHFIIDDIYNQCLNVLKLALLASVIAHDALLNTKNHELRPDKLSNWGGA
jgi:hypothetical protein